MIKNQLKNLIIRFKDSDNYRNVSVDNNVKESMNNRISDKEINLDRNKNCCGKSRDNFLK